MPSRTELVAHKRTEREVSDHIGADLVVFQTLPDLIASCSQFNPTIDQFDCSVFTGEYVTGGVDAKYLERLETVRNDNAKAKKASYTARPEMEVNLNGCSGPMNGADSLIGLAPSLDPHTTGGSSSDSSMGLASSFHSRMTVGEAADAAAASEAGSRQQHQANGHQPY